MEVVRSPPSNVERVSSDAIALDQNGAETPSSLTVSDAARQTRLLFPPTETTPLVTRPTTILNNVTSSATALQPMLTVIATQLNLQNNVSRDSHMTSSSATISPTMKKVMKTRKEREALRMERERLRAEAQALKEEEKLKKEEARLKREQEKKARRERREQEEKVKQEKKEAKEKERREKMEKKEKEKQRKEEEDRRKKEEKKKAELEKIEEKVRKQHKAKELFTSFFNRVPRNDETPVTKEEQGVDGKGVFDPSKFDKIIEKQDVKSSPYLSHCRLHRCPATTKPHHTACDDDDVIIMSFPIVPPRPRMKLLQFHSNIRPPYYGSWRKRSGIISGRAPFRMDKNMLDYECDSDDEWEEEEEQGESISSCSEGEESGGEELGDEEEGDEDGFFVPHGYLSEDEGEGSENESGGPGSKMDKVKAKAKAWEAEFKRTCRPKKPVLIGCIWTSRETGEEGEDRDKHEHFLAQFSALVLTATPIRVEPILATPTTPDSTTAVTDTSKRPVPEEAMPDLIRLVHQSTAGVGKLVNTFQTHWAAVLQRNKGGGVGGRGDGGEERNVSPPLVNVAKSRDSDTAGDHKSMISKRQLEKKIQLIAVKETRPPASKPAWYVHDLIFKQYRIDPLNIAPLFPPTTPISSTSTLNSFTREKSNSPEDQAPLTPVSRKPIKRKPAGNTPTLFEIMKKSPQPPLPNGNPAQKRLKLAPSPSLGEGEERKSKPDAEPPKKRIKLETLILKSPSQLSSNGKEDGTGLTELCSPIGPHPPSINPPSSCTTTPTRKVTAQVIPVHTATLTNQSDTPAHQAPPNTSSSTNNEVINRGHLLEVTNNQITTKTGEPTDTDTTEPATIGENVPHIDWSKLLSSTSSSSTSVTVIADIH